MIRHGLTLALFLVLAAPALAQDNTVGLLIGTSEFLEDSISFDLGADVQEFWYSRDLEAGTVLRLKLGQADFEVEEDDSELLAGDYEVEYALALIEYRFHEVYGSTSLFFGPGVYRQQGVDQEESNFGLSAGVSGDFPVTRRLGLVLEGAYHWVNFENEYEFLTIGGGVRVSF